MAWGHGVCMGIWLKLVHVLAPAYTCALLCDSCCPDVFCRLPSLVFVITQVCGEACVYYMSVYLRV